MCRRVRLTVRLGGDDATSIRQVIGMDANVIRLGIFDKAHGFHILMAEKKSLADTMHTIHNSAVAGKNNWVVEVTFLHESRVLYNIPTGQLGRSFV